MKKASIEHEWFVLRQTPFPEEIVDYHGGELVGLDTNIAGLVDKYIESKFDREDLALLEQLAGELESWLNILHTEKTFQSATINYFIKLNNLSKSILQRF
ncbi:MAG TPA: hypothetical protein PKC21_04480 [Oligoflexia bacterium]|nr:hypothetical protein [Oligoflexia bacterium]HMR24594.1 hypothetical protein [Oligoflexia bacterium]